MDTISAKKPSFRAHQVTRPLFVEKTGLLPYIVSKHLIFRNLFASHTTLTDTLEKEEEGASLGAPGRLAEMWYCVQYLMCIFLLTKRGPGCPRRRKGVGSPEGQGDRYGGPPILWP